MTKISKRRKVVVRLRRDKDGYPPFEYEGMWARPTKDALWEIDNVPFYVRGVSNGDVVMVEEVDGELRFKRVVRKGGHSTLRIYFNKIDKAEEVRKELRKFGCSSEVSNLSRLVSVDVRRDADYAGVRARLKSLKRDGILEYEDACIQHTVGL